MKNEYTKIGSSIVSSFLQSIMRRNDYSQTELAREIGIDQSTLNLWMQGKVSPNVSSMCKVCDMLGVDFTVKSDDVRCFYENS